MEEVEKECCKKDIYCLMKDSSRLGCVCTKFSPVVTFTFAYFVRVCVCGCDKKRERDKEKGRRFARCNVVGCVALPFWQRRTVRMVVVGWCYAIFPHSSLVQERSSSTLTTVVGIRNCIPCVVVRTYTRPSCGLVSANPFAVCTYGRWKVVELYSLVNNFSTLGM